VARRLLRRGRHVANIRKKHDTRVNASEVRAVHRAQATRRIAQRASRTRVSDDYTYAANSQTLKGAEYVSIVDRNANAHDELKHAPIIQRRISYLGWKPSGAPKPVRISDNPKEMFRFALENQNKTNSSIPRSRAAMRRSELVCNSGAESPGPDEGTGSSNRPCRRARRKRF